MVDVIKGLTKGIQSFLNLPGGRRLAGVTKESPLNLFDIDQANKAGFGTFNTFFKGQSLRIAPDGGHSMITTSARTAGRRKIAGWTAAGLLGANLVGVDPFGATSLATQAGAATFHAAVGGTMYNLGGKTRLAGIGYLAAMGINALRSGNQWGPL